MITFELIIFLMALGLVVVILLAFELKIMWIAVKNRRERKLID